MHKPAGAGGVNPHVLNNCSSSLNVPVTYIFIKSISEGQVPAVWLNANITPLLKKEPHLKYVAPELNSLLAHNIKNLKSPKPQQQSDSASKSTI